MLCTLQQRTRLNPHPVVKCVDMKKYTHYTHNVEGWTTLYRYTSCKRCSAPACTQDETIQVILNDTALSDAKQAARYIEDHMLRIGEQGNEHEFSYTGDSACTLCLDELSAPAEELG